MQITRRLVTVVAVATGIICALVYSRALLCGFVNLDDPVYVLDNEFIRHLDSNLLSWAFTEPLDFWIPLTFISLAIDYHFWGTNPVGYHLTNILLHAANTGLVVLIADMLLRERFVDIASGENASNIYPQLLLFSGLFFGIHPLRVESVAWVTERKDVLNGLFSFSSILFYLKYIRLKESGEEERALAGCYLLSIVFFGLSLLAKSSSVVAPAIFLVADYFPLKRLRKESLTNILAEKTPYLAMSLIVAVVTLALGSQKKILLPLDYIPLFERITISGNALFEYVRLIVYPVGIIPFYQIPNELPFAFLVKTIVIIIVTVTAGLCVRKSPLLFTAWAAFIIPFLPVLAFFQNGTQMLATRYTYLPSLVPALLATAAVATLYAKLVKAGSYHYRRNSVTIVMAAILLVYAGITVKLITIWDSPEKFWSRVIDIKPIGQAYKYRGMHYLQSGKLQSAIDDFTAAIENEEVMKYINSFNFYAFRGLASELSGRFEEAVADFTTAIDGRPLPIYYLHRARALGEIGRTREANEDLRRASGAVDPLLWYD